MFEQEEQGQDKAFSFLDFLIMILSIYVLFALLVDTYFKLPPEISRVIYLIDNLICFVFLYDFMIRLIKAPSKLAFLKWGWIDLISSIPTFEVLRYGRLVRLFRLLRVLRAFRSVKFLTAHIFRNKTQGTFAAVSMISVLMVIFSSISILQVENHTDSNIKTAEDAIWWTFETLTKGGNGDKFPVTTEGRAIAVFLTVAGVGLVGTFTGYIVSWFMESNKDKSE